MRYVTEDVCHGDYEHIKEARYMVVSRSMLKVFFHSAEGWGR